MPALRPQGTRRGAQRLKYTIDETKCRVCGRAADGLVCGFPPLREETLRRSERRILFEDGGADDDLGDCAEKMGEAPCSFDCPAGICVQGYVSRLAAGRVKEARELIRSRVALPNMLGRLCERPCEKDCVRGDYDEPIAVNRLKCYAFDLETDDDRAAYARDLLAEIVPNGVRVAVVGSGPAGLACAFDLRVCGYEPTIFEAEDVIGGIPGWAVPAFRMPREVIERDLQVFRLLGISMRTGVHVGRDILIPELFEDGFAAVFLGVGARTGARLGISGENLDGVIDALEFLRRASIDGNFRLSGRVVVIGGGNSAMDAARTAMRRGAASVKVIYRRTFEEMPADPEEARAAWEEGVRFELLRRPIAFGGDGRLHTVALGETKLGDPDESGRRRCLPVENPARLEEADYAIVAVGQTLDDSFLAGETVLARDRKGFIAVDPRTGATSAPHVFAGGDAVSGPASIVEAIAAGKRAAFGIDATLTKNTKRVRREPYRAPERPRPRERYAPRHVPPRERVRPPDAGPEDSVMEDEATYTDAQAREEAGRCLSCGLCETCRNCLDNFGCPAFYVEDGHVRIDAALCDGCGACVMVCPNGAIVLDAEESAWLGA
ncbi:MAG: FAD-dependent oxidoreductase [Deltaproteobacteria bacterium]|nr:FAD-dependent oxidoreductase [Deltaproteobacteria bacterium]